MTRRLSDEVFEFINRQGIDRVFLLPGGGAMHLVDAVSKVPNLQNMFPYIMNKLRELQLNITRELNVSLELLWLQLALGQLILLHHL